MILQTNKGPKEYKAKELDFTNVMCDLEENGIDVMGLLDEEQREKMKIFSTVRAILAALIEIKDLKAVGKILTEHLRNDGSMDEIMNAFVEVMESAGFGKAAEAEKKAAASN